jgi:hypothetical protein
VRTRDRNVRRERGDKGRARSSAHPLRLVAHHDTPLIAERAAMRGCGATEVGDELSVRLWQLETPHDLRDWMIASRPHSPALVGRHDAPHIGERTATRGRSATESGNEHAGVNAAKISTPKLQLSRAAQRGR